MTEKQPEIKEPDTENLAGRVAEIRAQMKAIRPKDIIEAALKQSAKDSVDELQR